MVIEVRSLFPTVRIFVHILESVIFSIRPHQPKYSLGSIACDKTSENFCTFRRRLSVCDDDRPLFDKKIHVLSGDAKLPSGKNSLL
jgi:hypothetical protein